jgi:hypothetical protein
MAVKKAGGGQRRDCFCTCTKVLKFMTDKKRVADSNF